MTAYRLTFLIALLLSSDVWADNRIKSEAAATGASKLEACDRALAESKKEALERMGVRVQAETNIAKSDRNGDVNSYMDSQIRQQANAVVKVLGKQVTTSYDVQTGLITCTVSAELDITMMQPEPVADGNNSSTGANGFTNWMSVYDYQKEFDNAFQKGFYPVYAEGRARNGRNEIRARFEIMRNLSFWSHCGISEAQFNTYNDKYTAEGYRRKFTTTFTSHEGATLYCATWVKNT